MKISKLHKNRKAYNWVLYDIGDEWLRLFSNRLKGNLYDLGCGDMPFKSWFLNYAEKYTGVDWGNSLHDLKADILADLNKPLPIKSDVADTVICLSVMEHLCEPQLFLNEVHRILKPGGSFILQVPFMWKVHEPPYDYYRYTRFGLQYIFEKAGFTEISIYSQTGFWVTLTLKFNYQTKRLIRGPWLVRIFVGILMRLIWEMNQRLARFLDKYWKCEAETASYFVTASK
jgi:SAM-dependent methyltransferase